MHRLGDGTKIADIEAARKDWKTNNRTCSTFPNKAEFDAFQEDLGEIVWEGDGVQLRKGATLKAHSRGGTRKIVHNCVCHNFWDGWTYYHLRSLPRLIEKFRNHGNPLGT